MNTVNEEILVLGVSRSEWNRIHRAIQDLDHQNVSFIALRKLAPQIKDLLTRRKKSTNE